MSKTPPAANFKSLPDVQMETQDRHQVPLAWVGMDKIPLQVLIPFGAQNLLVAAVGRAQVSLDQPEARGIHMSRLYEILEKDLILQPVSLVKLASVAQAFLESQQGLSKKARIRLRFSLPVTRETLRSARATQRNFPIDLSVTVRDSGKPQQIFHVGTSVEYSSTCPASLALARSLNADQFLQKFAEREAQSEDVARWLREKKVNLATPHAQRSLAKVRVNVTPQFPVFELPLLLESALKTSVQTLVKREDEQEFARLNGENPMFCEDAARRVSEILLERRDVLALHGKFAHIESLHPHDAVAEIRWHKPSTLTDKSQ